MIVILSHPMITAGAHTPLLMRARASDADLSGSGFRWVADVKDKLTIASSSMFWIHATSDPRGIISTPHSSAVLTNREGVTRQQLMESGNLLGNTKGRGIKREAGDAARVTRERPADHGCQMAIAGF